MVIKDVFVCTSQCSSKSDKFKVWLVSGMECDVAARQ